MAAQSTTEVAESSSSDEPSAKRMKPERREPAPLPPIQPAPVPPPVYIPPDPHSTSNAFTDVQFKFATVDGVVVPQIFRKSSNNELIPYVVVWMVELKLLWRFPNNYPSELKKLPPLRSAYISEDEGHLINEINEMHLCFEYGKRDFTKKENMLVRFQEFMTFYNAVVSCYSRIANNDAVGIGRDELNSMKGGFLQIQNTKCPYVSRKDLRLVPLSYLIHTDINLKLPDRVFDNFGFRPSPKECAFLNMMNEKLGLKLRFGMKAKLVCVDMVEKIADVIIKDLPSKNPDAGIQYILSPAELKMAQTVVVSGANGLTNQAIFLSSNGVAQNLVSLGQVVAAPTGQLAAAVSSGSFIQITTPTTFASPTISNDTRAALVNTLQLQASNQNVISAVSQTQPIAVDQLTQLVNNAMNAGGNCLQSPPLTTAESSRRSNPESGNPRKRNSGNTASSEPSRIISTKVVKENKHGRCCFVQVQGAVANDKVLALCTIRPCQSLLPSNAFKGDYVVLDQIRHSLFKEWSRKKFLSVLKVSVGDSRLHSMAQSLAQLFEDSFQFKVTKSDHCLLHLDIFLRNLPYLHIKYAETMQQKANETAASRAAHLLNGQTTTPTISHVTSLSNGSILLNGSGSSPVLVTPVQQLQLTNAFNSFSTSLSHQQQQQPMEVIEID